MNNKEKEFLIKFGQNIKNFREERNMSIQELSKLTGIRVQYLKRIEVGKAYQVNSSYIFIFAKAFKIQAHEVVKGL